MRADIHLKQLPPAPEANSSLSVYQGRPGGVAAPLVAETNQEVAGPPASHYIWIVRRHFWKIFAFVLTSVAATVIVSTRVTPIYEATATIDIDRQTPTGVIGQESAPTSQNDSEQFLATQIKLIQSDSVLRPVAQKHRLIDYQAIAATRTAPRPVSPEDSPVALRDLKVTRPPSTYLLLISYRSPDPQLSANVANGVAQSYIEHTYNIRFHASAGLSAFMEKQLDELRAKMERSSAAQAQFERELNVINPEEKTSILSARLLQLNTEHTNAQSDRVKKEAAFSSVTAGSLEAAQVSTQGDSLKRLSERLDEAQAAFAQMRTQFGANHPEYRKAFAQVTEAQRQIERARQNIAQRVGVEYQEALNRERMLKKAVADTKIEFDRLNVRSYEYQAIKREAENDKKLYEELVRKIKEAGINASFQNSSIRLADPARPPLFAVFPNIRLNAAIAFLSSLILALGAAVASDLLDTTIRDPEQITRTMKTQVLGSLPMVKNWRGKIAPAAIGSGGDLVPVAQTAQIRVAGFEEAIRTLRDSILLSDFDRSLRSLLVTSATPREGKTTTSVHLALAHASQKRKTLLIDADLRRPGVHTRLEIPNTAGLSDVVNSGMDWKEGLVNVPWATDLDVLPAGPPSRRAADGVGAALLPILEAAASSYDLIVVDAPPLLGFAEPLQVAALVDGVVLVTVAGQTDRQAVASVVNTLNRLRANLVGVVLNEVREEMTDRYHYHGYYGKYYQKYYRPTPATE